MAKKIKTLEHKLDKAYIRHIEYNSHKVYNTELDSPCCSRDSLKASLRISSLSSLSLYSITQFSLLGF